MKFRSIFVVVLSLMFASMGVVAAQHGGTHHSTPDAHHGQPHSGKMSATPGMQNMSMGAFYFTIENNGDELDRLVMVESSVAEHVEIHEVVMTDGVMQMVHQENGVEIPSGESLVFEPGSYHIMLIGLNGSLIDGEEFTATVHFEKAGELEIIVPIYMAEPSDDAFADPVKVGDDMEISNIWGRQAPKLDGMATPMASSGMQNMSMGAFYITIENNGDETDRLVKMESSVAETVEIHEVVMTDGVMQMVHQEDGVEIPAGESLVFEPGSYHIMLIGLNESLIDGEEFTATVHFEKAGELEINVPIYMVAPMDDAFADPVKVGDDIEISNIWSRQAPKLDGMATPMATPDK